MEGFKSNSLTMLFQITDSPKVCLVEENTDSSIHHVASMFLPVGIKQLASPLLASYSLYSLRPAA
jgi:hypothetical protein